MLATTHLAATTGLLLLSQKAGLEVSGNIIIWSYLLANLIDLDHIIFHPKLSLKTAWEFLRNGNKNGAGRHYLHSHLQEPWFLVIVLIISLIIFALGNTVVVFLPAVALTLHLSMDIITKTENCLFWPISAKGFRGWVPSNTLLEYLISLPVVLVILYLAWQSGLFNL